MNSAPANTTPCVGVRHATTHDTSDTTPAVGAAM